MRHLSSLSLAVMLALAASPAAAEPFVLEDTYWGGVNTIPSGGDFDVLGTDLYDTHRATVSRDGSWVTIDIETNYAGAPGTPEAFDTGYGDIFFAFDWTPQGDGPLYIEDQYEPGDWLYALDLPFDPGVATAGDVAFYQIAEENVVMSYSDTGGYRSGQAVQIDGQENLSPISVGAWSSVLGESITVSFNDGGLLGNDFAMSWAMTCGNDMLQGYINLPTSSSSGSTSGVASEPPAGAILALGLLGLAGFARRRAR